MSVCDDPNLYLKPKRKIQKSIALAAAYGASSGQIADLVAKIKLAEIKAAAAHVVPAKYWTADFHQMYIDSLKQDQAAFLKHLNYAHNIL